MYVGYIMTSYGHIHSLYKYTSVVCIRQCLTIYMIDCCDRSQRPI